MAKENFTAARIDAYTCTPGKDQTFHWDAKVPGLGLRVTKNGARSYVLECRIDRKTRRLTIGEARTWTLGDARAQAGVLKTQIDRGLDPRKLEAEALAARQADAAASAAQMATVGEAWSVYLEERRPHWGLRHYQDHLSKAQAGGQSAVRGTRGRGVTIPGPLYPLMHLKLSELSSSVVEAWAAREAESRPASARLAWRLLKGFLSWCSEQPTFALSVNAKNPAKTKRTRESLGPAGVKKDVLQRQQLEDWFCAVRQLPNATVSAYLQILLLIGARSGEVLEMRWSDLDLTWRSMTIRDKVEGTRTIPLTPYVYQLINNLPRRSEWIFASPVVRIDGKTNLISTPNQMHKKACTAAKIEGLTLHGLRRSFKSLSEWLDSPTGVVAQIMGHKPSATAEKHYTVREIGRLREHHETIEKWILDQAKIDFLVDEAGPKLSVVA